MKSQAYQFLEHLWNNNNTRSYVRINSVMQQAMHIAIEANMQFCADDFQSIFDRMRGGYWFGANSNGKGCGEQFYSQSIYYNNISAIASYENYAKIKPFILNGRKVCNGTKFRDNILYYRVTGFNNDIIPFPKINIVAYSDYHETGKRTLLSFDNKEWLEFRKNKVMKKIKLWQE